MDQLIHKIEKAILKKAASEHLQPAPPPESAPEQSEPHNKLGSETSPSASVNAAPRQPQAVAEEDVVSTDQGREASHTTSGESGGHGSQSAGNLTEQKRHINERDDLELTARSVGGEKVHPLPPDVVDSSLGSQGVTGSTVDTGVASFGEAATHLDQVERESPAAPLASLPEPPVSVVPEQPSIGLAQLVRKSNQLLWVIGGFVALLFAGVIITAIHKSKTSVEQAWELKQTLTGHGDGIRAVTFSPDGRTLASGSLDKTIKIWRVSK